MAITTDIAEMIYIKPLTKLYDSLKKLLKDNNIVTEDSVQEQKKIAIMLESMVRV